MRRRLALEPEVLRRADQAPAEELLPDGVDGDAGRERIARGDEPSGQVIAVGLAVASRAAAGGRQESPDAPLRPGSGSRPRTWRKVGRGLGFSATVNALELGGGGRLLASISLSSTRRLEPRVFGIDRAEEISDFRTSAALRRSGSMARTSATSGRQFPGSAERLPGELAARGVGRLVAFQPRSCLRLRLLELPHRLLDRPGACSPLSGGAGIWVSTRLLKKA